MIRSAELADVDRLSLLEYELFDNSLSPKMLERELEVGKGYVVGTPICGYALVREDTEADILDLTRLGVTKEWQGRGLGKQLLRHVLALGRTTFLTVRKNNLPALRLYNQEGFEIVGHLLAASAWVMRYRPPAPAL